jgi:hypothetical protein
MAQQPAPAAGASAAKPDAVQTPAASMSLQKQAELTPVTGSHISELEPAPTIPYRCLELDRAYIDRSGATNPREMIRTVPQANSH